MGQKVNPQGFRLGVSQPHLSHWFAKNRQYSQLLLEDHFLRESIYKKFVNAGIANIAIEREVDTIRIKISSAYPRQFLSAFNRDKHVYTGLESLRDQLTTELRTYRQNRFVHKNQNKALRAKKQDSNLAGDGNKQDQNERASSQQAYSEESTQAVALQNSAFYITIHLTKVADPNRSAACVSESIVEQLEKRVPFRRAMKQAIFRAEKANVKGIKVQISGRLNGAEIARSEWILKGRVPLHTLRAKVQYNFKTAKTIYGLLGVKVWVFADDT